MTEKTPLKTGDRLFLTLQPATPGYFYAFVLGEPDELMELFRAEGRERYVPAAETLKLPRHGFFLDEKTGRIRFVLVALPKADQELQAIVQQLPAQGPTQDRALIDRLQNRLLQLPPNTVQRQSFNQP